MARTRSRTGHGQWLLLAALLFGIVTMHTLGHPSGGSGGGHGGDRHEADRHVAVGESLRHGDGMRPERHGDGMSPERHGDGMSPERHGDGMSPERHGDGMSPERHGDGMSPERHGDLMNPDRHGDLMNPDRHGDRGMRVAVSPAAGPASASEPHDGGMAMDPLSVCLAVLGAFTLALLVRAGLLRPGPRVAHLRAPGRLLHILRPNPPPPRILLSRLSVLRI
ncbi:hypothetical protein ACH4D5_00565 [Streptomyces sp. NPDC018029]|uniref:hypothetical protein n=1 Tax=Streptomyces sp. NPDC018029 TaxID=3365032 RepID=UPI003793C565